MKKIQRRDSLKLIGTGFFVPYLLSPTQASAQEARLEVMNRSLRRIANATSLLRPSSVSRKGEVPKFSNLGWLSEERKTFLSMQGRNDGKPGPIFFDASYGIISYIFSDGNIDAGFYRIGYQNDGCCDQTMAALRRSSNVTTLAGPALLTLGTICEEYSVEVRRSFSSSQSAGILRDDCLPYRAGSRSLMSFEKITSNNVDVIFSKRTEIVISYRYSSSSRQWAESRFTMTSRSTKEIIFEGAFEYRTGVP